MKRLFMLIGVLALLVGGLALTACGGNSGEQDARLVGTWEWEFLDEWRYVFNGDGTGDRGMPGIETETFSWSTDGDTLTIRRDSVPSGEIRNERWTYTISGTRLTIHSQDDASILYNYNRRP